MRLGQGRENCIALIRGHADMLYALYDLLLTQVMADRGYDPQGEALAGYEPDAPSPTIGEMFEPTDTSGLLSEAGVSYPS